MAKNPAPEPVTLSASQLEDLLVKLAACLPAETYQLIEKILRTFQWLMSAIEAKDTTIGRLARIIFGAKTEKTKGLFPKPPPAGSPGAGAAGQAQRSWPHGGGGLHRS